MGEVYAFLLFLKKCGCSGFDCSENGLTILKNWEKDHTVAVNDNLERAISDIKGCRLCGLHQHRKTIVFGEGAFNAKLVFVGEGPGYDEDQTGRPFVGKAGQLLTRIIQAMHLKREDVYICNILKCRPPGNRNPKPDEIQACLPYLRRQIRLIQPDFICALGTFAAQTLLETDTPISRLRGNFYDYDGIQLIPTYHPSYLLRNPEKKRDVWEDIQKLMQEMSLL
jgi:DNA polymerase